MIANNGQKNQLPKEIKAAFDELEILKHLRNAGIKKSFGFTCAYLFQLIFCLIFEQKNWFRLLNGKKSAELPAKMLSIDFSIIPSLLGVAFYFPSVLQPFEK